MLFLIVASIIKKLQKAAKLGKKQILCICLNHVFFIIRMLHLNGKKSVGKNGAGGQEERMTRKKCWVLIWISHNFYCITAESKCRSWSQQSAVKGEPARGFVCLGEAVRFRPCFLDNHWIKTRNKFQVRFVPVQSSSPN